MLKRNFFSVLLLAIGIFYSCTSNETEPTDHSKEIPVVFQVSTLNVETQPMSKNTTSGSNISDIVNSISIYIFNKSGERVNYIKSEFNRDEDPVPDNFGSLQLKLLPGTYDIIAFALGKGTSDINLSVFDKLDSESYFTQGNREVFYYKGEITVNENSNNFDITLPRKSALLQIKLTGEVPEYITKVECVFNEYSKWYPLNSSYTNSYNFYEKKFNMEWSENVMNEFNYYFAFLYDSPQNRTINIKIYGGETKPLVEKSISVPLYENRKTIVSGDLFSSIGDRDFSITIDDSWGENVDVPIQ